jgi:hypothetical protein
MQCNTRTNDRAGFCVNEQNKMIPTANREMRATDETTPGSREHSFVSPEDENFSPAVLCKVHRYDIFCIIGSTVTWEREGAGGEKRKKDPIINQKQYKMAQLPRHRPSPSGQPRGTVSSHAVLQLVQSSMTMQQQGRGRKTQTQPSTGMSLQNLLCRRKFAFGIPALLVLLGLWTFSMPSRNALQSQSHMQVKSPHLADLSLYNHTPPLPTWMQDYVEFYHSQLEVSVTTGKTSLKPDAKYLLWTCRLKSGRAKESCGGIGDRLNGIVQGLYMAICTNRVLLVDWEYPDRLTALEPALLPWILTVNVPPSGIIKTIDNRKDKYLLDPSMLPDDAQGLELWGNLWLYEPIVRQTKCLREYWKQHGGLDDSTLLYQTAFWTLFQWSPAIVQHATDLKRRAGLTTTSTSTSTTTHVATDGTRSPVRPYIALHVRTGKGASWVDPKRHAGEEDLRRFYQCARTIQQGIRDLCPPLSPLASQEHEQQQQQQPLLDVYVASDNTATKETLQQWDAEDYRQQKNNISNRTFRLAPHLEVFHIDRSHADRMHDPATAALDVWAELSTLLDATCLVTSRSHFSELPTWLSPQQPRCQVRFDHCSAENVTIALEALREAGWRDAPCTNG